MPVSENNRPKVRLYNNDMEAYLQLPYPEEGETYIVYRGRHPYLGPPRGVADNVWRSWRRFCAVRHSICDLAQDHQAYGVGMGCI